MEAPSVFSELYDRCDEVGLSVELHAGEPYCKTPGLERGRLERLIVTPRAECARPLLEVNIGHRSLDQVALMAEDKLLELGLLEER